MGTGLFFNDSGGLHGICRQLSLLLELVPDASGQGHALVVTPTHGGERIAQPIAQAGETAVVGDEWPGTPVGPGGFSDKVQQHEGIARSRARLGEPIQQDR